MIFVSEPGAVAMGSHERFVLIGSLPLSVLTQRSAPTAELTRRREFTNRSTDQL
jgi:hypothetical protein